MEFLKEALGEELYGQVAEKLKDGKIKLADLSGGAYVGRDKHDALTAERDGLKAQLSEFQMQLKAFEGVDAEKLQGEITRLSGELATAQESHAKELAKLARQGETKDFLGGYKFINDETRDHYMAKLEAALDDDGNKNKGRKDIFDAMVNGEDGNPRANIFEAEEQREKPPAWALYGGRMQQQQSTQLTGKEAAMAAAQAAMGIKQPKG